MAVSHAVVPPETLAPARLVQVRKSTIRGATTGSYPNGVPAMTGSAVRRCSSETVQAKAAAAEKVSRSAAQPVRKPHKGPKAVAR